MPYKGPERRVHKVYVTPSTEYHVRGGVCIAVRDLQTGQWLRAHAALARKLCGGLRFERGAITARADAPEVGESLYFQNAGHDVITSLVTAVCRPSAETVAGYSH